MFWETTKNTSVWLIETAHGSFLAPGIFQFVIDRLVLLELAALLLGVRPGLPPPERQRPPAPQCECLLLFCDPLLAGGAGRPCRHRAPTRNTSRDLQSAIICAGILMRKIRR